MAMLKGALIAVAAMTLWSGSAFALDAKARTEAPGLPDQVWAQVSDFCAIKDWHPAIAGCVEKKDGDVLTRVLTLKGGGTIIEKLTAQGKDSYNYEMISSPLPVKNYKAKLWIEADDEPDRSAIYWTATFDANGASDAKAKEVITGILKDGVKGIKEKAIAAADARDAKSK